MELGIKSKTALVTAASQGLGKAAALALAKEGTHVAICSRREKEITDTANEIRGTTGAEVLPLVSDVSKASDIRKLVESVKEKFGPIHILVNNAGGPPTGDIFTITDEQWHKGFGLTFMSVVRLCRAVLPMMIQQEWGRIITITSVAAKQPINDLLVSSALRPGILGLTKVLSNKYAKDNITVNTICPGNVLTNRQKELMEARSAERRMTTDEYMAQAAKEIPTGRLGRPEEMGDVIAFLASEQASYINGVNLLVDGGMARGIS